MAAAVQLDGGACQRLEDAEAARQHLQQPHGSGGDAGVAAATRRWTVELTSLPAVLQIIASFRLSAFQWVMTNWYIPAMPFTPRQIRLMTAMTDDSLRQCAERASRRSYDAAALSEVPEVIDELDGGIEDVALMRSIQDGEATDPVSRADVLSALEPRGDQ